MMKNTKAILLTITMLCIVLLTNAQEYTVSGNITGIDVDYATIAFQDKNAPRGYRVDSIKIENDHFSYTGTTSETSIERISFYSKKTMKMVGRGYIPTKSALLHFIAYPGADIKINGKVTDFCDAYASGDLENDKLGELLATVYPDMNSVANIAVKSGIDSTLTEAQKKEMELQGDLIYKGILKKQMTFIEKNISSVAGLWMLEDMIIRSQVEMEKVAELMEKVDETKYSNLGYYKALMSRVEGFKTTGIGMIAPPISGFDVESDSNFELKSLQGKYVLIDFWGTWCGACLAGVPEMKDFQSKHSDLLQIVGLAKDNSVKKVKECMVKNGMNWPNILIGKGDQDYVAKYNVQGFPTKILLDRNGKILLRSVGESEEFYAEMEELIQ